MVIIKLPSSSGTAALGALGQVAAGVGMAQQQKEESERRDELLNISKEKLKIARAHAQGQQQEQQRADSERAARLELDELRKGGVATPSDIKKVKQFGITRGVGENIVRSMGGLGFDATAMKEAEQKAQKQQAAIDGIFPHLAPRDRQALLVEFKQSEDANARMKMAGGIATKLRNYARMKDVLPDEAQNAVLDQHIAAVEKYLEDPTPEGMQGVLQSEDAVERMVEEQQADVQRQTIADGFDTFIQGTFTDNMPGEMIQLGLALASKVRIGKLSANEAKGQWNAESDPRVAEHTARHVAKTQAAKRRQELDKEFDAHLKGKQIPHPDNPEYTINQWVYPGEQKHRSQGIIGTPDWKMAMRNMRNAYDDNPTPRYDRNAGTRSPGAVPAAGTKPPAGKPTPERQALTAKIKEFAAAGATKDEIKDAIERDLSVKEWKEERRLIKDSGVL